MSLVRMSLHGVICLKLPRVYGISRFMLAPCGTSQPGPKDVERMQLSFKTPYLAVDLVDVFLSFSYFAMR